MENTTRMASGKGQGVGGAESSAVFWESKVCVEFLSPIKVDDEIGWMGFGHGWAGFHIELCSIPSTTVVTTKSLFSPLSFRFRFFPFAFVPFLLLSSLLFAPPFFPFFLSPSVGLSGRSAFR